MTTEAGIGVMHLRAEERHGLPATARSWDEARKEPPPLGAFRESMALSMPGLWTSGPDCKGINFSCFTPHGGWSFVTAAPGNTGTTPHAPASFPSPPQLG